MDDSVLKTTQTGTHEINSTEAITSAVGNTKIDFLGRRLLVREEQVHLTGLEFAVLELLVERRSTVVTKRMFLDRLYAGKDEPEAKIIDVFICKLRRKLKGSVADLSIETVWGRGYVVDEHS